MEETLSLLTEFFSLLRQDILKYYNNTFFYLKDLISYKNINLNKTISTENEVTIKNTLERMIKTISTGLNIMGVPMKILSKAQKDFMKTISSKTERLQNYDSYFKLYKEAYLDKILFEILIEYLTDVETKKIETLNLFELLPQNFITSLNQFKEKYLNSKKIKELLKKTNFESLVNFSNVSIRKDIEKPPIPSKITLETPEEKIESEPDILTQLRTAREDNIETLKIPKKELVKPSLIPLEKTFKKVEPLDIQTCKQKSSFYPKKTQSTINTFIDYFGNFPSIHPDLISKFNINTINLINSRVTNLDFIDLECLFFYVSILKMLNIDSPFTSIEILEIIKNYVNNSVFSSSKHNAPDPINNFYGLSVISELNLLKNISTIDLFNIEKFIKSELELFVPEKLELNFYSLLCLKLLGRFEVINDKKDLLLGSLLNLKLAILEKFKPIVDIFHKLTSIKLLDGKLNISKIIEPYIAELKRNFTLKQNESLLITNMANALLIFDVLDLKEQEVVLSTQLLNSIINITHFFELNNPNKDFNWHTDKLAYKIELKMLYYALFACSRYYPLNLEKF